MTAFESIRSQVLQLSVRQRFELMFDIQESMPCPPHFEQDDGMAEAMHRLQEGDNAPSIWLNEDQFNAALQGIRKK